MRTLASTGSQRSSSKISLRLPLQIDVSRERFRASALHGFAVRATQEADWTFLTDRRWNRLKTCWLLLGGSNQFAV